MRQSSDNTVEELIKRGFIVDEESGAIKGFNANQFALFVKSRMYIIYAKDGWFYLYEKGVWGKEEETMILVTLRDILQEPRFGVWTLKREKEYIEALKRTVYYKGEMNPYKNFINLQDCMFNTDDFTIRYHDANFLSSIQIPVEYDSSAKCPRFIKFLEECFQGDEERITVAQEWLGYLLTAETQAQKALILYGGGGNGKGVFSEVLTWLIGEDNISNIPLNELNKGFSRVCIYNKTANISNENETEGKGFNTQYFKSIVGEDTINAEQKNKPVFSFKPTAKLVMSMNNLPYTNDKSTGYYRRLSILQFSAYIPEEKRDKQLKEKLKEEIAGIFNWAVEGLKRLRQNNYNFSKCTKMKELLSQYQKDLNPIIQFFEECIEIIDNDNAKEDTKLVYNTFKNWAYQNGLRRYANISNQGFWREFDRHAEASGYKIGKSKSNAKRFRTGIKVVGEYKATSVVNSWA
jgi:putative DNA primase/helicase